ncbi:MAG: GDYXXLXY domain-containing protein [Thermoanaerobaculia bacterium]
MSSRVRIAVAVQVALMLAGLVSPLLIRATGTTAYLETRPVDPRALFRGDYVILSYAVSEGIVDAETARQATEKGKPLYVTITTDRPARFVKVDLERPELQEGQACLIGRVLMSGGQASVDLPQVAQYFVAEGEGREIESQLGEDQLAVVKTSRRCTAVLVGLEPR